MTASAYHEEDILGKAYDHRLMRRLLKYLRPYRVTVVISIALLLVVAALQLVGPYLTKIAIDRYISSKDLTGLVRIALLYLAVLVFQFTVRYLQTYIMQLMGQRAMYDLRMELFSHLQRQSLSFFDKNPVGRLMTRLTSDVQVLNQMFTEGVVAIFGDIFILLGIVIVMLAVNLQLALVTLVTLPLLVLATVVFRKKVREVYRLVRTRTARLNAFMQEHISGMSVIQLFAQEGRILKDFEDVNSSLRQAYLKTVFYYAVFFPVVEIIGALSLGLIVWYGGGGVLAGSISSGVLVAFIQYAEMFFRPIRDLSEKYNILQAAMASSERVFRLLDTEPSVPLPERAVRLGSLRGEIEFRDVHFSYNEGEPVLEGVSFRIEPGQRVAFVGATGAGKTSIMSLLSRFYEYQKGEILIDEKDLRQIDPEELRQQMALVLQDVFIFSGDILTNIRLGNEEISLENVRHASEYVNADKFISGLSDGYTQPVGERGSNLSVGQKQLLAFARALVFDPRVLILDEATSSVDTETELLIREALRKLIRGRTSLIIAHRLSTIQDCDKIIVIHKGKVREEGTHQELLRKGGIYYRLYQLQYKDQEVEVRAERSEVS
jgi:ATP-binding cassette subfamily B multidrug efflux pump